MRDCANKGNDIFYLLVTVQNCPFVGVVAEYDGPSSIRDFVRRRTQRAPFWS